MKLYKREVQGYNDGFIFKSYDNYESGKGVCYIPEYAYNGDRIDESSEYLDESFGYTRKHFKELCEGTKIESDYLFEMVDWQSPETLLTEMLDNEEDDELGIVKTTYIVESEEKIKNLRATLKDEGAEEEEIKNMTVLINHTLEFIESDVFRLENDKSDTSKKELLYYDSGIIGLWSKALTTEEYTYYALDGGFYIA